MGKLRSTMVKYLAKEVAESWFKDSLSTALCSYLSLYASAQFFFHFIANKIYTEALD